MDNVLVIKPRESGLDARGIVSALDRLSQRPEGAVELGFGRAGEAHQEERPDG